MMSGWYRKRTMEQTDMSMLQMQQHCLRKTAMQWCHWQPLIAGDNVADLQAQVVNNNIVWLFCSSDVLGAVSSVRRCQTPMCNFVAATSTRQLTSKHILTLHHSYSLCHQFQPHGQDLTTSVMQDSATLSVRLYDSGLCVQPLGGWTSL